MTTLIQMLFGEKEKIEYLEAAKNAPDKWGSIVDYESEKIRRAYGLDPLNTRVCYDLTRFSYWHVIECAYIAFGIEPPDLSINNEGQLIHRGKIPNKIALLALVLYEAIQKNVLASQTHGKQKFIHPILFFQALLLGQFPFSVAQSMYFLQLARLEVKEAKADTAPSEYCFNCAITMFPETKQAIHTWEIGYAGKVKTYTRRHGEGYAFFWVNECFKHPGKTIQLRELYSRLPPAIYRLPDKEKATSATFENAHAHIKADELQSIEDPLLNDRRQPVSNKPGELKRDITKAMAAKGRLRKEIKDIQNDPELTEPEKLIDIEKKQLAIKKLGLENIERDIYFKENGEIELKNKFFVKYAETSGYTGKGTKINDLRGNVDKQIKKILKTFNESGLTDLATHLTECLTVSVMGVCYKPSQDISWNLTVETIEADTKITLD